MQKITKNMKRIICIALGLFSCISLIAGNLVSMKQSYYGDMPGRTTLVVLPDDNNIINLLIRDAVESSWFLSPYEFCDTKTFESLKTDTTLYFLVRYSRADEKAGSAAMEFLSLVKGSEEASKGLENMEYIITLPLQSSDDMEGSVFPYIPVYLNIMQNHVLKIVKNKLKDYIGIQAHISLDSYNSEIENAGERTVLFSENDFAFPVTQEFLDRQFKGKARLVSEDEKATAITERAQNTLVAFTVRPTDFYKGADTWSMIVSADSRDLYYYGKFKFTEKEICGFRKYDIRRISRAYRKSK